jgi:hypothetical protein
MAAIALIAVACGDDPDATASFTAPTDGARIAGLVPMSFTAEGITIEPAGEARNGAGHFHVIADQGCLDTGKAVPVDSHHVHFGKAQSEGVIYLGPGTHELCLQVGDGEHGGLDVTDTVTVEVGISNVEEWCATAAVIDELFDATDNSSDEFSVKQLSYENIRRLLDQASDAIDQVDAAARDDVATALDAASRIAGTLATAADASAAEEALRPLWEGEDPFAAAAPRLRERCGVDITS